MFGAGALTRFASASSGSTTIVANPATSWAVLVGVSTYDRPTHPTYGGDGDVNAMHALLNQAGWSDSHILILTEQAATAQNIRQAINWLDVHSGPNTFSVFHYSGHVYQNNGHEYIWGVDNNFIANDEFSRDIGSIAGRAWIDISGCESSGFDQGVSGPLRFFTASSMVNEKSYEDPSWHESVWTGLAADRGMLQHQAGSGPLSIQAGVRWAQQQAPSMTSDQQPHGPQHPYAVGGDGEWYLGPAVAPSSPAPPSGSKSPPPTSPPDTCSKLTLGYVRCGGLSS